MSARLRRLQAEYERLDILFRDHDRIRIAEAVGDPPEKYIVEYRVRGLVETKAGIEEKNLHRVQITLGPDYPRVQPECVALDPIFHPNIDYLAICTADVSAASQKLEETIIFIGEMIMYQAYNLQSPRNGDARVWTEENLTRFPLENIELRPRALLEGAELPVRPIRRTSADSIEPESGSAPATEIALLRCANCNRQESAAVVQTCSGGHLACSDCLLGCSNCGRIVCALCELENCVECHRTVCADCLAVCACGRRVCAEHAWQCSVCRSIRCGMCPVPCRACGTLYCQEHMDGSGVCPACQPNQPSRSRLARVGEVRVADHFSPLSLHETLHPLGESPAPDSFSVRRRNEPEVKEGQSAVASQALAFGAEQTSNRKADWDSLPEAANSAASVGAYERLQPVPYLQSTALGLDLEPVPARVLPHVVITEEEAMAVPASALAPPEPWHQIDPIESATRSGKAVVSLIFGILGIPCLGLLVGWFAVLFGVMALRDIKRGKQLLGRRLAIFGVTLGVFDIVLWFVLFATYGPSLFVPRFGPVQTTTPARAVAREAKA